MAFTFGKMIFNQRSVIMAFGTEHNVHMTLVKSAPKKRFTQKTILPIQNCTYDLSKKCTQKKF
jgi:hypothetical protein